MTVGNNVSDWCYVAGEHTTSHTLKSQLVAVSIELNMVGVKQKRVN